MWGNLEFKNICGNTSYIYISTLYLDISVNIEHLSAGHHKEQ